MQHTLRLVFHLQEFFHPSITNLFVDGQYLSILQCCIYFEDFLQPLYIKLYHSTCSRVFIIYFITFIKSFQK